MSTSITPSRVHIIGGGLGGLTLARLLQVSNVPLTVYEREPNAASRAQGGTLDLHPQAGQLAMRLAGLYEQFDAQSSRLADTMMIRGKDGVMVWQQDPPKLGPNGERLESEDDRPEIDRGVLRKILLDSLEPGTVQWDHTLRSISPLTGGKHQLVFETGSPKVSKTVVADFVVGADGTWSRTRAILTSAMPIYEGVSFVETEVLDVDERHPNVAKFIGDGTMFAIQDQKGLIVQRNSGGRCKVYVVLRTGESWVADSRIPFDSDPEETRRRLLGLFDGWDESIHEVLRASEPMFIPRTVMALDPKTRWESREGITLLGDAAHVMSPFAGKGVNLAMLDAVELCYALLGKDAKGKNNSYRRLSDAVSGYENKMFKRFRPAGEESRFRMDLFISDQAPHVVDSIKYRGRPLALAVVSTWRLLASVLS